MKRVLAAASVVALTLGLSATSAVAHLCPCFPPGASGEASLPPEVGSRPPAARA